MKIFDASNSVIRPDHRGYGGPIENGIVTYLKKYALDFGWVFIQDLQKADIIFTNDIYPEYVLNSGKPLVKRMDGIFFQAHLQDRNQKYNEAAQISDHVIFVSEFSRDSYSAGDVKTSSVALNAVDPKEYTRKKSYSKFRKMVAIATHWGRPEKRYKDIIELAKQIKEDIYLIGTCDETCLPHNVHSLGYLKSYAHILESMDGMINLSYRDAAPKTVSQGLAVGLPILYAASGGVPELVGNQGIPIDDPVLCGIESSIPDLDPGMLLSRYQEYVDTYSQNYNPARYTAFEEMLAVYFNVFRSF